MIALAGCAGPEPAEPPAPPVEEEAVVEEITPTDTAVPPTETPLQRKLTLRIPMRRKKEKQLWK